MLTLSSFSSHHTQDTFSFALLLLCLGLGDMNYLFSLRFTGAIRYYLGGRPVIPAEFDFDNPELVRLIVSMWQPDFRLRPSMKVVLATLTNLAAVEDDKHERFTPDTDVSAQFISDDELEKAKQRHASSPKPFAVFL